MTVPLVGMQGSNAVGILAPSFCIGNGPSTTVAYCGGQSGALDIAALVFCTVNRPF
jgi:hypothetical protein